MGSRRVRHDWATELNWSTLILLGYPILCFFPKSLGVVNIWLLYLLDTVTALSLYHHIYLFLSLVIIFGLRSVCPKYGYTHFLLVIICLKYHLVPHSLGSCVCLYSWNECLESALLLGLVFLIHPATLWLFIDEFNLFAFRISLFLLCYVNLFGRVHM